ncbi:Protein of unknown function, partial [Cotesia congregata]
GIADWAKDHGLQVNLNKTKSLIIGSNSKLKSLNIDSLPPIIINNVPLPYVSQTKCLGLSLNNDLLWKNYVSQTVRKVNAALYTLKTRMNIYTTAIRKLLVTATILLLIDYCTVVLIDATADNNLKLQRALNSSIRFIYNLKRDEHITPYRRKLNWLSSGHDFQFDAAQILDYESHFLKRNISEMFFIKVFDCVNFRSDTQGHGLFADDKYIYLHFHYYQLYDAIRQITTDAQAVVDWAKDNGLEINVTKTKAMLLGSSGKLKNIQHNFLPLIVVNGISRPGVWDFTLQIHCLGIFIRQKQSVK